MSADTVELLRAAYAALARGDLDVIAGLLDPDVRWHGGEPGGPGSCRSRSDVLTFMRRAHARGAIGELVEIVDAGDRVVVILRRAAGDGHRDELIANLSTLRDGRVVEMVHYPDPEDALAAVGRR